ncbi:MAG: transketolase [Candidatus Taylorbacteria bacterium]|nr:transketolase [Candidatus Taylorbacteria bacterium]
MALHEDKIKELEIKANLIRQTIIEALVEAGSGHTAGPLDMADIFTYLYFYGLKHNPKKPDWPERDRLVLSNGHICPVLYATMAHAGYFSVDEYKKTLRKFGTKFQGHPHRDFLPALETSSGPLGSGLSQAVGMALADRIDYGKSGDRFFYALLSDGEHDCGNTWEAVLLAGKEKLGHLIAIVDRNNIQIDGFTEDIMPLEPFAKKYEAFNWHVQEIDGHSFSAIDEAVNRAKAVFDQPSVIIARTIPGKGVKEFERDYHWHGKPPSKEEGAMALAELRTLGGKIKSEHQ